MAMTDSDSGLCLPEEYEKGYRPDKALIGALEANAAKDLFIGVCRGTIENLRQESNTLERRAAYLQGRLQQSEWARRKLEEENFLLKRLLAEKNGQLLAKAAEAEGLKEELARYEQTLETALTAAHDLFAFMQASKKK